MSKNAKLMSTAPSSCFVRDTCTPAVCIARECRSTAVRGARPQARGGAPCPHHGVPGISGKPGRSFLLKSAPLERVGGTLQSPLSAPLERVRGTLQSPSSREALAHLRAGRNFAVVDMISLRPSLSIAGSNYFVAAIACSTYVAAVDMTSLQNSLSAIAGSNFAAVDMISLRRSLSIADSHYFAAAITGSNQSLQST